MRAVNPATGEVIAEYKEHSDEEVDAALDKAVEAFELWRERSFEDRAELMRRAAGELREQIGMLAHTTSQEMGKPITEARSEVEKCAWACEYFADEAEGFLEPKQIETDASKSYVHYEPLGPILAVMPWNFPLWQVFRFVAPHLMAGNVGLLKHAANVPGCAQNIENILEEAGFPEGVFQNLYIGHEQSDAIIRDDRTAAVTLTGSVRAGSSVGKTAGEAIKPSVLELGGSDPFIVLEDCDLDYTVQEAVRGRTLNSGQSCIAAKRFIVEDGIYDEFVEQFRDALSELVVGDPVDEETDVGPMAREDLREDLHEQVEKSVDAGAECLLGGQIPAGDGFFYPVTLLTEVDTSSIAFREETFGPVAAVIRASDADHAVKLANDSKYGLGASIWTTNERGEELMPRIESGHVAINGIVKSDPRLPFGGIKKSGYGRELSKSGIMEFVNKKTVWVK